MNTDRRLAAITAAVQAQLPEADGDIEGCVTQLQDVHEAGFLTHDAPQPPESWTTWPHQHTQRCTRCLAESATRTQLLAIAHLEVTQHAHSGGKHHRITPDEWKESGRWWPTRDTWTDTACITFKDALQELHEPPW